jgi:hypothetical protein
MALTRCGREDREQARCAVKIIGTALAIPIAVMVITVIPGVVVVVVIIGAMMVVAAVIIAVPPATCLGLV